MDTVLNIFLFFAAVIVSGLVTLLLAMAIGWLLKFVWSAPEKRRHKAGLIVLGLLEVSTTVGALIWLLPQLSNQELGDSFIPQIVVPIVFRVVIYYSTWKFFDEDPSYEKTQDQSEEF